DRFKSVALLKDCCVYCTFSSQLHTCTSGRFSAKRVVSFCLGSGAVPKKRRLAFSEKYKGAFSLIIHEAGNALSPRSAISLPGVLFSARYRLLRVAAESLWEQNR